MSLRERWDNSSSLTKFILGGAPAIGAFLGAFASAPAAFEAWDTAGFPTPAMRAFVRGEMLPVQKTQAQTTQQVKDLQLDIALGKRENYDNEKAKWQLEMNKATDDGTRALAIQQIQKIDRTNDAINEQIRAIRGVHGPN